MFGKRWPNSRRTIKKKEDGNAEHRAEAKAEVGPPVWFARADTEKPCELPRFRPPRAPGCAFHDNAYIDLQAADSGLPATIRQLLEGGPEAGRAEQALRKGTAERIDAGNVRLLPPCHPRKIICLGLNYRDHAAETGAAIPKDPVLFSKYATALIGPTDAIVLPPVSQEVDYEAELVVVVGKRGRPKGGGSVGLRGRLHGWP